MISHEPCRRFENVLNTLLREIITLPILSVSEGKIIIIMSQSLSEHPEAVERNGWSSDELTGHCTKGAGSATTRRQPFHP